VKNAKTNLEKILSEEIYKHLEIYAFSNDMIKMIAELAPTDLERIEKLEQLRLLEHGLKVKVVVTEEEYFSVKTPSDLELARKYYLRRLK
jgi:3-deoxy-manno-octulosonate cytidylyltransferase (CMP-KDO synthetase)